MTPMIEFIDKHCKTVIIKVFHMLKKTRTQHYFFSVKGQIVHNLGFPDHTISVTTNVLNPAIIIQKAAINSVLTNMVWLCSKTTYLQYKSGGPDLAPRPAFFIL